MMGINRLFPLYKHLILVGFLLFLGCSKPISKKTSNSQGASFFVDSLLSEMTLKEKIGQMNQYSVGPNLTGPSGSQDGRYDRFMNGEVGSVLNLLGTEETRKLQKMAVEKSRLGIPLIFSFDVIHGYRTMFPIPLGESASWDLKLIEKSAQVAAKETAASGVQWTFAPMIDVSRDARWGRVMEGSGEDTYLSSVIAEARINGFQGNDLADPFTIAACAKHFAGYGFAESGKDYNAVNIGLNTLHNTILPPFKLASKVGVATFMNAFNDIDGVPSTSNNYLLRDLLKGAWNYDGVVVSDWNSIGEIMNHGVAKDEYEASQLAIAAGCDIDMEADAYIENLEQLVEDGKVDEVLIDDAVRRIIKLKVDLGLFEDPYRYFDSLREQKIVGSPEHHAIAKEVATKSIVLLKNEGNLLPLKSSKKIGVIGPLAKDKDSPLGNWRANAVSNSAISLYEGLMNEFKGWEIGYAEGCKLSIGPNNFFDEVEIEENDRSGFASAIQLAKQSEIVIMALGETAYMSGEARSRSEIGLPGLQLELLKEVYKVNKNIVLVLMNGRPLTIPWESKHLPAIVEAWHLGSQAGNAIAEVLSGKVNPSGKLPMSFPRTVGQLPIYYNHLNTGRPSNDGAVFYSHHMDVDRSPLYPFGFGLSYSIFNYENLRVTAKGDHVEVEIDVTNSSEVAGEEVIQLYIRDLVASISRPVLELKDFDKIQFEANERKTIQFDLDKDDISFYNTNGELIFEAGEFEIFVGTNAENLTSKIVQID